MVDELRNRLSTALGDRYEIVRLLGRGGMGAVYLAREPALDRLVALKVLLPERDASDTARERFRREAKSVARLSHPNIVPLHAFGEVDGMPYFVMGYVRGTSLAERLRQGPMPAEACREILGALADALAHAHRHDVVHRDVKPDNILIDDESGRPLLTDFGIARMSSSDATLTETGTVVGTAHYMSPEQAAGDRAVDGRSDLYSLGAVGFAMLAGRPPFEGDGFWQVASQHASAPAPSIASLRPDTPLDLVRAIQICLEKDPEKRWADGRALRAALDLDSRSGDQIESLPGTLRGLRASVIASVLAVPIVFELALYQWMHHVDKSFWNLVAVSAPVLVALPVATAINVIIALRRGDSSNVMRRVASWPPRRWSFWWPRSWRRNGDVWDRLPRIARIGRHLHAVFWLTMLVEFQFIALRDSPRLMALLGASGMASLKRIAVALGIGSLLGLNALIIVNWRHWRKRGLGRADAFLLIKNGTAPHPFWRQPDIAAVLQPGADRATAARGERATAAAGAPRELARSLEARAAQLSGVARSLAENAASAAWRGVAYVDALDDEIRVLSRDSDPAEFARLEHRLAALGLERVSTTDDQRAMRSLLEGQLDLMRRLRNRCTDAEGRRERALGLLRSLWLQVAELRAEDASRAFDQPEVTARIRAVCADLERQAAAEAEVAMLVGQPAASPILRPGGPELVVSHIRDRSDTTP